MDWTQRLHVAGDICLVLTDHAIIFLALRLIDRNDLVEDVSTSGSGSSRCHDRPERIGRDRPPWGSRRPRRSDLSDADIDPIEGLVVVIPSSPIG